MQILPAQAQKGCQLADVHQMCLIMIHHGSCPAEGLNRWSHWGLL